LFVVFNEKAVK